jgi:hypothetical protein
MPQALNGGVTAFQKVSNPLTGLSANHSICYMAGYGTISRHYAFAAQFLETRSTDPLATVSMDYHAHVQMIMSLGQSCIDVQGTAAELQLHTSAGFC